MVKESQSACFDKKLIKCWEKNSNFVFIQNYFPSLSKPQRDFPNDYLLLRLHILFPQLPGWYALPPDPTYAIRLSSHEKALQLQKELNTILRVEASRMIATVDSDILTLSPVIEENLVALLKAQSNLANIKHPDRTLPPTFKK